MIRQELILNFQELKWSSPNLEWPVSQTDQTNESTTECVPWVVVTVTFAKSRAQDAADSEQNDISHFCIKGLTEIMSR